MHEVGLMQNILNTAIKRAKQEGGHHIYVVEMRVGAASGVAPESLELAFEVVKKGTIADMAKLEVNHIPIVCYCSSCQLEFQPVDLLYECPHCQQISTEVRQGKEFELASLEVS
jgi:hydrogenase nickel incorporation protein HypA/HybF